MIRTWIVAGTMAGLYLVTGWMSGGDRGLRRTILANPPDGVVRVIDERQVEAVSLEGIQAIDAGAAGLLAQWRGWWKVPADGLYDVALTSRGLSSWTIDGERANETGSIEPASATRTVWLAAGFHRIDIAYAIDAAAPLLIVAAAPAGQPPTSLEHGVLMLEPPDRPRLRAAIGAMHVVFGWLTILVAILAIRKSVPLLADGWRKRSGDRAPPAPATGIGRRAWSAPLLAWTALGVILVHGALLRIDAITERYGAVTSPRWFASLQSRSIAPPKSIRPASIVWEPEPLYAHRDGPPTHYASDPYTYLHAGRTITSFYAAQWREPVFPYATKISLAVFDGQDVAVSAASTGFSCLAIWLTYMFGAALWSRPAGLLAALGLSLDIDVVSLASLGWRDDAYMAVVIACSYLLVRWRRRASGDVRMLRPGPWQIDALFVVAAVVGVAGGLAILTRIMAVSFLLAAAGYAIVAMRMPWRRKLIAVAIAAGATVLVSGPYFVNCWRVYGDPFHTFNVHGGIYSAAEGQAAFQGSTADYVVAKLERRPFEMLDTIAQGLTTYPFENKWQGLNAWAPGLGAWAAAAALVGLVALAATADGRLTLLVLVTSLLPFSLTWTVDPNFRFTLHAYPFLLIAAAIAIAILGKSVWIVLAPARGRARAARPKTAWFAWAGTVAVALAALYFVQRVSPALVFTEALRVGEDAAVTAGARDSEAFLEGWSAPIRTGNVATRVVRGEAAVSLRLPDEIDYPVTIRMDPFPRPLEAMPARLPIVDLELNGAPVASVPLQWTPGRVGSYDVVLPRSAVRRGVNRLVFRVKPASTSAEPVMPGLTSGAAAAVWYIRVHPPAGAGRTASPGAPRASD